VTLTEGGRRAGHLQTAFLVVGIRKSRRCATRSNNKRSIQRCRRRPLEKVVSGLVFGLVVRAVDWLTAAVQDNNPTRRGDVTWASRSWRVAPSPFYCARQGRLALCVCHKWKEWGPGGLFLVALSTSLHCAVGGRSRSLSTETCPACGQWHGGPLDGVRSSLALLFAVASRRRHQHHYCRR
jgi:hypothetical protein